jgi:carbon monoxide dehydrogenase subunit G
MQVNVSRVIPAPQQKVWTALYTPAMLAKCIPGCEKLAWAGPEQMAVTMALNFGLMKTSFSTKLTLFNVDAPKGYNLYGQSGGGSVMGAVTLRLTAEGAEATRVDYGLNVTIDGKIAKLGGPLIEMGARRMATEFLERLAAQAPLAA